MIIYHETIKLAKPHQLRVINTTAQTNKRTNEQTNKQITLPDSSQQHFSWCGMDWLLDCKNYFPSAPLRLLQCDCPVWRGEAALDALRRYEGAGTAVRPTPRLGEKGGSWEKWNQIWNPELPTFLLTHQPGWRWRMPVKGDWEGWHLK